MSCRWDCDDGLVLRDGALYRCRCLAGEQHQGRDFRNAWERKHERPARELELVPEEKPKPIIGRERAAGMGDE